MKRKIIIGGLIIGLIGLNSLSCSRKHDSIEPKSDYVKICDVKYEHERNISNPPPKYNNEGNYYLSFRVKRVDREGIKVTDLYFDEKGLIIFENDCKYCQVEEGNTQFGFYINKGKHSLKAILEDCEGNKLEDSYVFEVK